MQRLLWLTVPLVMSGCVVRDHERDHEYDSSWEYESSLEVEGGHGTKRATAGSEACVTEPDRDAAVATSERTKAEPQCRSNDDCQATSYCDKDSSECVDGVACQDEASCEAGYNCDLKRFVCTPTDNELCSELKNEASCAERDDCVVTYAGVNCSCGADCTCMGGEAGCVCERFEFHACTDVTTDAGV
jgi:hypothetical protein